MFKWPNKKRYALQASLSLPPPHTRYWGIYIGKGVDGGNAALALQEFMKSIKREVMGCDRRLWARFVEVVSPPPDTVGPPPLIQPQLQVSQ